MRDCTSRIYRAKRKDTGEWVYGYLWCGASSTYITPYNLGVNYDETMHKITATAHEVDPDTIGQSTGRYDKNEKRIYEDDIILKTYKDGHPAPQRFRMMRHTTLPITERVYYGPCDYVEQAVEYEVVGNIHDNKEAAPC